MGRAVATPTVANGRAYSTESRCKKSDGTFRLKSGASFFDISCQCMILLSLRIKHIKWTHNRSKNNLSSYCDYFFLHTCVVSFAVPCC
uniref:Uncharacterized protein n=1 Tax=Ixodes ricinus TaxID=34613 RepID=A0A6B0UG05_IXORI